MKARICHSMSLASTCAWEPYNNMQIIRDIEEMQDLARERRVNSSIGLVPTMGALHAGHAKLVERARAENDLLVASIFVNPLQFGPSEDLERYPRPFERDCEQLEAAGCDFVFAPDTNAMYGEESGNHAAGHTVVEVLKLGDLWEGAVRPGHLRGVATVVCKLFNIVTPTRAYFGEKDFQQLRVIQVMVRDLNFAIEIVPVPTVREADGLALSSRNAYLSPDERIAAPALYRALQHGVAWRALANTTSHVWVSKCCICAKLRRSSKFNIWPSSIITLCNLSLILIITISAMRNIRCASSPPLI